MKAELFDSIILNLQKLPGEWDLSYGSAKRTHPWVEITLYYDSFYVGGVHQTLSFFQKRKLRKVIDEEAMRRFIMDVKPGKPNEKENPRP